MASKALKQAVGVFPNRREAEQAISALLGSEFFSYQISVVTIASEQAQHNLPLENLASIPRTEGARAGAIVGGTQVGLTTLTIGLGVLLIPGIGPALAVESLLLTFFAGGIAAAVGGLHGAFLGWFSPQEQTQLYRDRFADQDCLVIVKGTERQIALADPVLRRWNFQVLHPHDAA
ncbi:hypothetical protein [Leptolyngbya ohadii]|uniref:hypothetical protein n=1 Tax=Leptolyngbya ohadii TaxID=1962290 RepID=UPI000B59C569|nr:hypothetical protein [Leptolyngbya ohadii]